MTQHSASSASITERRGTAAASSASSVEPIAAKAAAASRARATWTAAACSSAASVALCYRTVTWSAVMDRNRLQCSILNVERQRVSEHCCHEIDMRRHKWSEELHKTTAGDTCLAPADRANCSVSQHERLQRAPAGGVVGAHQRPVVGLQRRLPRAPVQHTRCEAGVAQELPQLPPGSTIISVLLFILPISYGRAASCITSHSCVMMLSPVAWSVLGTPAVQC